MGRSTSKEGSRREKAHASRRSSAAWTTSASNWRHFAARLLVSSMPPATSALVTGATQGIGRATAFALGRAGYRVGICARTRTRVDELVAALKGAGIDAAGVSADVGDPAEAGQATEQIAMAIGEIGVLVNNAGVLIDRPF